MENLKRFSMVLLAVPALFIGCSNNKTSSLKPETPNKKITTTQEANTTKLSKKELLLASAIFGGELSFEEEEKKEELSLAKVEVETPKLAEDKVVENTKSVVTEQLLEPILTAQEKAWLKSEKVEEILRTAKEYLGVKYIWAANGPSAFDCSGFTKYVFKKNGISLPRYSGHQANIGQKVEFENLKKGDLVFFDTAKKFTKTVNHVGIFIGNHKFIHASSGGKKVMITCFKTKKFYKNKFLYARRVVNTAESFVMHTNANDKSTFVN